MDRSIASRLLILIACCFVNANPYGMVFSFGALYVPLLEHFQEDRATTAAVQSTLIGVTMCTAIIWGILSRKFGLTKVMFVGSVLVPLGYVMSFFAKSLYQLIVCIGALSGIGTSALHVCSTSAITRAFDGKRAGIAISIHSLAIGIGTLAYPFLMEFLLHHFEINELFLLLGGINLNNLAVAMVICFSGLNVIQESDISQRSAEVDTNTLRRPECIKTVFHVIKYVKDTLLQTMNARLGVAIVVAAMSTGCLNGFLVVVVDLFESKGFSPQECSNAFLAFNVCNVFGRILIALSQLKPIIHPMAMYIILTVSGCVGQILILKGSGVLLAYIGSVLSGMSYGGLMTEGAVATVYFARRDMVGISYSLMTTTIGLVSSATGPLCGWARDELQSYDYIIGTTAGILGLTALPCLITLCVTKDEDDEKHMTVYVVQLNRQNDLPT